MFYGTGNSSLFKYALVLLVVVSFPVAPSVAVGEDRAILIDFGVNTQQTTTTGWNNFTGAAGATPTASLNLVDSRGIATGITLIPTWSAMNFDVGVAGTAANFDGPYPIIPVGSDPPYFPSALRDSVYVRDGESLTLTLSNLSVDSSYGPVHSCFL